MSTLPEPWLRGPIPGVHPLIAPLLYAFQQAREDLASHTAGLTTEQVWATPYGYGSLGFHIRHMAGSTDRLMTYLQGKQLSEIQMTALRHEHDPGASLERLLAEMDSSFQDAESIVRALNPANLGEPRGVGRKLLPTTIIGLLTHIAEHTQRHVGQAIAAAKLARVGNLLPNRP
jgi:uncharacterized damage-inducible protein DinB